MARCSGICGLFPTEQVLNGGLSTYTCFSLRGNCSGHTDNGCMHDQFVPSTSLDVFVSIFKVVPKSPLRLCLAATYRAKSREPLIRLTLSDWFGGWAVTIVRYGVYAGA